MGYTPKEDIQSLVVFPLIMAMRTSHPLLLKVCISCDFSSNLLGFPDDFVSYADLSRRLSIILFSDAFAVHVILGALEVGDAMLSVLSRPCVPRNRGQWVSLCTWSRRSTDRISLERFHWMFGCMVMGTARRVEILGIPDFGGREDSIAHGVGRVVDCRRRTLCSGEGLVFSVDMVANWRLGIGKARSVGAWIGFRIVRSRGIDRSGRLVEGVGRVGRG